MTPESLCWTTTENGRAYRLVEGSSLVPLSVTPFLKSLQFLIPRYCNCVSSRVKSRYFLFAPVVQWSESQNGLLDRTKTYGHCFSRRGPGSLDLFTHPDSCSQTRPQPTSDPHLSKALPPFYHGVPLRPLHRDGPEGRSKER